MDEYMRHSLPVGTKVIFLSGGYHMGMPICSMCMTCHVGRGGEPM